MFPLNGYVEKTGCQIRVVFEYLQPPHMQYVLKKLNNKKLIDTLCAVSQNVMDEATNFNKNVEQSQDNYYACETTLFYAHIHNTKETKQLLKKGWLQQGLVQLFIESLQCHTLFLVAI